MLDRQKDRQLSCFCEESKRRSNIILEKILILCHSQHQNFAFTLAEVLITLGIIGVVAAMTLPQLINRTQDLEYKVGLKKMYSQLSSVVISLKDDNGGTLAGLFSNNNDIVNQFATKLKVAKICPNTFTNCWLPLSNYSALDNGSNFISTNQSGLMLTSGELLSFEFGQSDCAGNFYGNASPLNNICGTMYVDVNGLKKPNKFGVDVFAFWLTVDNIRPMNVSGFAHCDRNASVVYNGWACSSKVLNGEAY